MPKRKQQNETSYREDVQVLDIEGVGWAVVSDDASKPLTERDATTILIAYRVLKELLGDNFDSTLARALPTA